MKYSVLVLLAMFSTSCFAKDHLMFSCINKQNKVVEVKSMGNYIQYSFGKKDKPELVFKNTKDQVIAQTKKDLPPNTHSSWVVLKNGAYSYLPRTAFGSPNQNGDVEREAGVWIKKNGELLSSEIICDEHKGASFADFDSILDHVY